MDAYWPGLFRDSCLCHSDDDYEDYDAGETELGTPCSPCTPCSCVRYLPQLGCSSIEFTLLEEQFTLLCADRVTQMTKAYNDIEAVSTLLEEKLIIWKERDLELAARIGQSLLERNKELESKSAEYETQLVDANDLLKQLRHDVAQKDALLQMYIQDEDASPSPEDEVAIGGSVVNIPGLQRKVRTLEEENINLLKQTANLQTETDLVEEKEQNLFRDCVRQLEDYKNQVLHLQTELISKADVNLKQQQDITSLTERRVALEQQNKQVKSELSEITKSLQIAQEVQTELATEISELESQNSELEVLLHESQEETRSLRKKQKPSFIRHHASYNSPFLPEGSLALELEDSVRRDTDSSIGDRRDHNRRVMRTARAARKLRPSSGSSSVIGSSYQSEAELSDCFGDNESVYGSNLTLGRPGLPGSNDLDLALRRLSQGQGDQSHDESADPLDNLLYQREDFSCKSPDSMLSLISDGSKSSFKMPEKLQIVKPLEGSQTLHQWRRLATPHLGGVLEARPGIQTRGDVSSTSDTERETYSLSDYEEDGMSQSTSAKNLSTNLAPLFSTPSSLNTTPTSTTEGSECACRSPTVAPWDKLDTPNYYSSDSDSLSSQQVISCDIM